MPLWFRTACLDIPVLHMTFHMSTLTSSTPTSLHNVAANKGISDAQRRCSQLGTARQDRRHCRCWSDPSTTCQSVLWGIGAVWKGWRNRSSRGQEIEEVGGKWETWLIVFRKLDWQLLIQIGVCYFYYYVCRCFWDPIRRSLTGIIDMIRRFWRQ